MADEAQAVLVPYDHIVTGQRVFIDGVLAFMPGDPVPLETAKRVGLKGKVARGTGDPGPRFTDSPLQVTTAEMNKDAAPAAAGPSK